MFEVSIYWSKVDSILAGKRKVSPKTADMQLMLVC